MKLVEWIKHLMWERDFSENHVILPLQKRTGKDPYAKKVAKIIREMGATYCCHEANRVKKLEIRRVL
jgi:hypothetical protein